MAEPAPRPAKGSAAELEKQPWVEKYRPKSLDEVVAHKDIVDTISRLTKEDRLPHLLLYGPPGTGKTSTILALAKALYGTGSRNMTLELNASDERGIDVVRQQIQDFASTKRIFRRVWQRAGRARLTRGNSSGFKLILLDECDAMTKDAQMALRRVIERYTRNTRFCLICNHVAKVIPALQSRCTRFRFAPLPPEVALGRLRHVAAAEGLACSEEALQAVQVLSGGDMRRALNTLQATAMAARGGAVDADAVYACTGAPRPADVEAAAGWLLNEPFAAALHHIRALQAERGLALVDVVRGLLPYIMRLHMPPAARIALVEALAEVEHRLCYVTAEALQRAALVGAFVGARAALAAAAG